MSGSGGGRVARVLFSYHVYYKCLDKTVPEHHACLMSVCMHCVCGVSPVLLLGILIGNKKYHCSKFFNVLLIVAGVAVFMYTEVRGERRRGRGRGRGGGGV